MVPFSNEYYMEFPERLIQDGVYYAEVPIQLKSVHGTMGGSTVWSYIHHISIILWKIYLDLGNLCILLFQTIYSWSLTFSLLTVYEKHFHLTQFGSSSLILTAIKTNSPITTLLVNYTEKLRNRGEMSQTFMSSE